MKQSILLYIILTVIFGYSLVLSFSTTTKQHSTFKVNTKKWQSAAPFFGGIYLSTLGLSPDHFGDPIGGGIACAGCTIVTGLLEQLTQVYNQSIDDTLDMICDFLPEELKQTCADLVGEYGSDLIILIDNKETADAVCHQLDLCTNSTCRLYPPPSNISWKSTPKFEPKTWKGKSVFQQEEKFKRKTNYKIRLERAHKEAKGRGIDDWTPWDWIWHEIQVVFNSHEPLVDFDGDLFGTEETLRGTFWRGKDCDDFSITTYPGRKASTFPDEIDFNCNGISGHDESGVSYEKLFCSDTPQYGIAILGDSAGAHFHIPPSYVTATEINEKTYSDLVNVATMEGDWPEMSATTGFYNNTWIGHPVGKVESTYLKMLKRNRCMHRDFQSIAVNGARSSNMQNTMHSLKRNSTLDQPLILTLALIGNDVCNGHPGLGHMTTPEEFYTNILNILTWLDNGVLPKGSFVSIMGLIDGRILYNTMHQRIHPIGALRKDVTYKAFYDFLDCLNISPCWGWMNKDAYWRNQTTDRAFQLNAVYPKVIAENKFKNFNVTYMGAAPMPEIVKIWKQMGGETYQLIEPVDGFHPTQISNALTADYQWKMVSTKYPWLVPAQNPHNEAIVQKFGNQGGY